MSGMLRLFKGRARHPKRRRAYGRTNLLIMVTKKLVKQWTKYSNEIDSINKKRVKECEERNVKGEIYPPFPKHLVGFMEWLKDNPKEL